MSDQASARLLAQQLAALLHRHGRYVVRSADMRHWADLVESRGGWANPSFLPELHGERTVFLAIFASDGRFAGALAWRVLACDDYVARMRAGTEWAPDAAALGWTEWPIADAPRIAGHIHDRGGLFVDPAFRGDRLSWYLTGLQWCEAIDDRADFVVSHTLPKVSTTSLPRFVYGYDQLAVMPEHSFPWHDHPFASALVWSDAQAVREEVARRLRFLRQCHAEDLGHAARGYERYQRAVEGPALLGTAPVDERDARPA